MTKPSMSKFPNNIENLISLSLSSSNFLYTSYFVVKYERNNTQKGKYKTSLKLISDSPVMLQSYKASTTTRVTITKAFIFFFVLALNVFNTNDSRSINTSKVKRNLFGILLYRCIITVIGNKQIKLIIALLTFIIIDQSLFVDLNELTHQCIPRKSIQYCVSCIHRNVSYSTIFNLDNFLSPFLCI